MKIQISPTRIVKDALTVWYEDGPEVDLVMDVKKLTFQEGYLEAIFVFHVLEHLYPKEILATMENWYSRLNPNKGALFVVVDDYEFITRSFVGGDVNVEMVNDRFNHPTQFTRDNLVDFLVKVGFKLDNITIWFDSQASETFKFTKQPFELVLSSERT